MNLDKNNKVYLLHLDFNDKHMSKTGNKVTLLSSGISFDKGLHESRDFKL